MYYRNLNNSKRLMFKVFINLQKEKFIEGRKIYFYINLTCARLPGRILALEKLGAVFNQVAFPLQYTPRKFVIHPETNNLILIETDHNAYTEATKAQRKQQMAEVWLYRCDPTSGVNICLRLLSVINLLRARSRHVGYKQERTESCSCVSYFSRLEPKKVGLLNYKPTFIFRNFSWHPFTVFSFFSLINPTVEIMRSRIW